MQNATPIRKITIKDVMGDMSDIYSNNLFPKVKEGEKVPQMGPYVPLMKIAGIALKGKPGQTDKGEYVKFSGDFIATNLLTGEAFMASQAIVPNFLAEQIYFGLRDATKDDPNATVQFAFQFLARHNATTITKYEYKAESLLKVAPTNAMAALLGTLEANGTPLLTAPPETKKTEEKLPAGNGDKKLDEKNAKK